MAGATCRDEGAWRARRVVTKARRAVTKARRACCEGDAVVLGRAARLTQVDATDVAPFKSDARRGGDSGRAAPFKSNATDVAPFKSDA